MNCKTWNGVTQAIFDCVKMAGQTDHGTVYDPSTGNTGTATTDVTAIGTIVLSFDFDPTAGTLTYCVIKKPWIVSISQIFDGIDGTVNVCRGSTFKPA
jgi:hypothetical protein